MGSFAEGGEAGAEEIATEAKTLDPLQEFLLGPVNGVGVHVLRTNPKKMATRALDVYPRVRRANRIKVPAHLSMSTINVEPVAPAIARQPQKKLSPLTVTGRNGIVHRYFYFAMSLLFVAIVVAGFKRTVNDNLLHPAIPRPFILWIHGAAFAGWVVFFISQSALVRIHKVSWHRSIGWFGAGLATVMVPLGTATAIIMARFDAVQLHLSDAYAFLSIPFYDMIAFGVLIALAIYWRTKPELHRRLIFIATCGLMDAPSARFDYVFDHNLFFPCLDLLILLGVARDLVVDRRVHRVYLRVLPLLIVGQGLAVYMWRSNPSWWQRITHAILG